MALSFAKSGRRFRELGIAGTGLTASDREANAAAVIEAVAGLHADETAALLVYGAAELHFGPGAAIEVPEGAHLKVLRRAGGHFYSFPNFGPYSFYTFRLGGRRSRISFFNAGAAEAWMHGPTYPYMLHGIQVNYTPGSAVLTRAAGETRTFDAGRHQGRTAYANYYDASGNLQAVDTMVLSVDSADQITLAAVVPASAQAAPAQWPRVGIDLDSEAHAATLAAEGVYWSRRPSISLVRADVAGPAAERGTILGTGLYVDGRFQTCIDVTEDAADVILSDSVLAAHETSLQAFSRAGVDLAVRPRLHLVNVTFARSAYEPQGRTSGYYSPTHGHHTYASPNYDHLLVKTPEGSGGANASAGSYKLYSETGVTQPSLLNVVQGLTFTDVEEGWTPTTIGSGTAFECHFIRTPHAAADGLRMIGGTMEDSQILRIRGIFGTGDPAADKLRYYEGVTMTFAFPGALVTDGLDYTGEQRTLLVDCDVTIDVPLGYDYDLWLQTGDAGALRVLELRGGVYTATRLRRLARLVAGMTLRLTDGVRLVGEPEAGVWVELAGGTLEAAGVDLSGTTAPLT